MTSETPSPTTTPPTNRGSSPPSLAAYSELATIAPSASDGQLSGAPAGYELSDEIGRGGMGVVYRARDLRLDREVAVKLLRDVDSPTLGIKARFVSEAKITVRLAHPGIPAVHELGELDGGRPFLAMKLVRGRTLAQLLAERKQEDASDLGRFLATFEQICHAVGYAYAHGVIHRDLKPANVMVGEFGEVQVMDWGLAKRLLTKRPHSAGSAPAADSDAGDEFLTKVAAANEVVEDTPGDGDSPTQTGAVLGTLAYMAPEQAAGKIREVDARSDVFGLGAILFHILAGRPPYQGASMAEVRLLASAGKLSELLEEIDCIGDDPEVTRLCRRCLSVRPEDRPADGSSVAAEISRIRADAEARAIRSAAAREGSETAPAHSCLCGNSGDPRAFGRRDLRHDRHEKR